MRIPHRPEKSEGYNNTDGTSGKTVADKIAIIAQKYAGYFTGTDYRFDQQAHYAVADPLTTPRSQRSKGIHLGKKWKEPTVLVDDCDFCKRLTDAEAVRRVAGYQHQIDIEILRSKTGHYSDWLRSGDPSITEFQEEKQRVRCHPDDANETPPYHYIEETVVIGKSNSAANRRKFIELTQDVPRVTKSGKKRPTGWEHKSMPIVDLPLRAKRKMCVEWNHVYRDYLKEHPLVTYDFDTHEFYKEVDPPSDCAGCGGKGEYNKEGIAFCIHTAECTDDSAFHSADESMPLGVGVQAWLDAMTGRL